MMKEEKELASSSNTSDTNRKDGDNRNFKKSIARFYNEGRPASYYQIMTDVEKFSEWYTILCNCRKSGETGDDVLLATHSMWKDEHNNKGFKYEHVWRNLKERENLAPQPDDLHADKKVRTSESGAYLSLNNLETRRECDIPSCSTDQQKAKMKWEQVQQYQMKNLALREVELKLREDEIKERSYDIIMDEATFQQMQKYQTKKLALREEELNAREDELELRENDLKIRDYEMVMKDTSGMSETQLKWHMKMVEEITERQGLNMS